MKKTVTLILVLTLVAILAVPAFAAKTQMALKPADRLFETLPDADQAALEMVKLLDAENLSAEEQEDFAKAYEEHDKDLGNGVVPSYFFYANVGDAEKKDVEFAIEGVTDKMDVFAEQYIDENWVTKETVVVSENRILVKNVENGPMRIVLYAYVEEEIVEETKEEDKPQTAVNSPSARKENANATASLPVLVSSKDGKRDILALTAVEDEHALTGKSKDSFSAAQKVIRTAVPAQMKAQYFFFAIPLTDEEVNAAFEIEGISQLSDVVIKQYIENKWVEMELALTEEAYVVANNVQKAPMLICTK